MGSLSEVGRAYRSHSISSSTCLRWVRCSASSARKDFEMGIPACIQWYHFTVSTSTRHAAVITACQLLYACCSVSMRPPLVTKVISLDAVRAQSIRDDDFIGAWKRAE